jgi:hypothetical protein
MTGLSMIIGSIIPGHKFIKEYLKGVIFEKGTGICQVTSRKRIEEEDGR